MNAPVLFEARGAVGVITLSRPRRRNAIDAAMSEALAAAINRLEGDPALRVGVLAGEGPVFCAGMDLAAFTDGAHEGILFGPGGVGGLTERARAKPLIAAVHGAAVAGGFELALACDMIVGEEGARFGLPEVARGLIAGAGGALRLASLIPPARAREILLTGRLFDTTEAWELGLLSRRCPPGEGLPSALDLAREIAAQAPLAIRNTLAASRLSDGFVHDEALFAGNRRLLEECLESEDAREGARAFLERRPPRWAGR